jgi:hypothetical protein
MAKTELNEWTLMFYIGGDNQLSPLMVSELKAIKDAGFQRNTSVLVHFDPNENGAPTRIFDVNGKRKKGATHSIIGDGNDPFVRNLVEDKVDPKNIGTASAALISALDKPYEIDVKEALKLFLGYCRENHRARHYILFLVGHGMVVGNDAFLPDEHPASAISLTELDGIVRRFSDCVKNEDGELELLALHSCSMSAVEVAFQLKGVANYMMATEGLSFVGSWPYRQLLKKTFNAIETAEKRGGVNVPALMNDLYFLSLFNATDFLSAGYSSDLALCRMGAKEVGALTEPIQKLVAALKSGLDDRGTNELILLAHWRSQSYWQESYTDLFDFCRCLAGACDSSSDPQRAISEACGEVMKGIDALVVHSDHFGSKYQYSHGLSIYFPWSRPIENAGNGDAEKGILQRYQQYAFTTEVGGDSWLSFLEAYFDKTQRPSRNDEDGTERTREGNFTSARESFDPLGVLSAGQMLSVGELGKPAPSMGASCTCPSIKNYAEESKDVKGQKKENVTAFSISDGALQAF